MTSKFQMFDNPKFLDYYPDLATFKEDYENLGIPKVFQDQSTIQVLYWLLCTRYGVSTVLGYNFQMFRPILFTRIWQYGGTWQKRVKIQQKLRGLSLQEGSQIYKGGKAIYNSAFNDSSAPSTQSMQQIAYINSQNTTNFKKSTLEGLALLNTMLETDVTQQFLDKFSNLFKKIIYSGNTQLYPTYEQE